MAPSMHAVYRLMRWRAVQRWSKELRALAGRNVTIAEMERVCRSFLAALDALDGEGEPNTEDARRAMPQGED